MKNLAFLLLLPSIAFAQLNLPPICNGSQCYVYILTPIFDMTVQGQQNFSLPYSALVPLGETRDLQITFTSVGIQGAQLPNYGVAFMTVEAPANSRNWKLLCRATDGESGGWCQNNFSPAVVMTRNDELCLMIPYSAYPPTQSWFGNNALRRVGVQVNYTIGP
jgi:hypothetical protein